MQRNNARKKKKWITASVAGALAVAVVGTALYNDSSVALARPSLPGIEDIVNGNSKEQPFTILEIVGGYDDARIGYMVAGEEPGDKNTAMALSDMASPGERADYYMTAATTTENTTPYTDLKDFAFTYDSTGAPYTETGVTDTTAGAKNFQVYGTFTENTSTPTKDGRYDLNSVSADVYVQFSDTSLTIQQVYERHSDTDGSGEIFMNYGGFAVANGETDGKRYDITSYSKVTDDIEWMKPFKLEETSPDPNKDVTFAEGTTKYNLYAANLYDFDKQFAAGESDPADGENVRIKKHITINPDGTQFTSQIADGDRLYYGISDVALNYYGYISAGTNGVLLFNEVNDPTADPITYKTAIPVEGYMWDVDGDPSTDDAAAYIDTDYDGVPDTAIDATNTCLAYKLMSAGINDHYVTMSRSASESGYYISGLLNKTDGYYHLEEDRFVVVNDPDKLPDVFGIVDESSTSPAWYHNWFYKRATGKPYVYNENGSAFGTPPANHNGGYDFKHDFTLDAVDDFYYTGGYNNREIFKQYVLDVDSDKCANICIDVITKRAMYVTADDINNANLIYFTGTTFGDSNDMPYESAKALITQVATKNKPVILNFSCYSTEVHDDSNHLPNLKNAMLLLLKDDIDGIDRYLGDGAWNISTDVANSLTALSNAYMDYTISQHKDASHVIKSVFINDDLNCRNAIYSDFNDTYSDAKINGFTLPNGAKYDGFTEVQKDIDEELFYLQVAQKDTSNFNKFITKATSIRYILNFGDRRTVGKTEIRVLDLEPYYARDIERSDPRSVLKYIDAYYNNSNQRLTVDDNLTRDIFDKNWFNLNVSNTTKPENIQVTGMGTKEFIGKIEDLNENYDLIYIGMDTAYLNTSISRRDGIYYKSTDVVSNDGTTYVYRHTGDDITVSGMTGVTNNSHHNLSGDDITPDKFRELQNYVKAGYAVILSDEFFIYNTNGSIDKIDENKVDKNSWIYKFVDWCMTEKDGSEYKYFYKNVNVSKNFEDNSATTNGVGVADHRTEFVRYLNLSKLEVEVISMPPLYNPYDKPADSDGSTKPIEDGKLIHNYIGMNAWGEYSLEFEVKLTNDAAVDTTNTSYNCKLYIDHDADGRFEDVEALDSIEILNDNNDVQNPDDDGKFHLTTGTTYKISRRVPEGYVGLIPWKLVFIENRNDGNELIKTAIQDYSAISDNLNKPTIKILQLTSDGNPNTGRGTNDNHLDLRDDVDLKQMYQQVIDFNISVDKDTVTNFVNQTGAIFGGGVDRLEKLYDYDMLVMGFTDVYNFRGTTLDNSKEAILAVRQYMLSGKSILFTHDLTSSRIEEADDREWGVLADHYLRDIQGMDRYGSVGLSLETTDLYYKTQLIDKYESKYDETRPAVADGLSDPALLRHNNARYGEIAAQWTRNTSNNHNTNNDYHERELRTVSRLNRGQVTEYPFRIGALEQSVEKYGDTRWYSSEYIKTATTHHQYFQLDMETDYTDTNYDDDIVVWYTISVPGTAKMNYHRLNYNDARNNYYIYNKGNITYTGAGHSYIDGKEEKELFVNTLVAAYNAGTHAPYAAYKNNATIRANDVTSQYVPYDISLKTDSGVNNGWLNGDDTTITVYFKAVNNNLQDNKREIVAQYYVEVPNGTAGALKVGTKSYKIITPIAAKDCTLGTDLTDKQVLTNGHIYEFKYRVADLMNGDVQGVNSRYHAVIYTRMRALTKGKTIDDDKRDLANTDAVATLPANDSFKPLNINFTQLYDLK